jgi:hypothetical protein
MKNRRPDLRHTPVHPLYNKRGDFIGYECEHCGLLLTPSGRPSEPVNVRVPVHGKPGVVRFVKNQAHFERLAAMRRRVFSSVKDKLVFWRD